MVKSKTLLIIAGIVWIFAGFNVLRIGVLSYSGYYSLLNMLYSLLIFLIFWFLVFKKLVTKHTGRIKDYNESKQYIWKFFDIPSFIIMTSMISIGIIIRVFNLLPDVIIAVFYSGLGSALLGAGMKFLVNYYRTIKV